MSILDTLKTSGALPINELNIVTPGSPDDLVQQLTVLHKGGLVAFDGTLPEPKAVPEAGLQIRLTRAGLKQSLL